jgi:hypothetical protein
MRAEKTFLSIVKSKVREVGLAEVMDQITAGHSIALLPIGVSP